MNEIQSKSESITFSTLLGGVVGFPTVAIGFILNSRSLMWIGTTGFVSCMKGIVKNTFQSRWDTFFTETNLLTKCGTPPELLEIFSTDVCNKYIFKIPVGKKFEDYSNKVEELKSYNNNKVEVLKVEHDKFLIKVIKKDLKDMYRIVKELPKEPLDYKYQKIPFKDLLSDKSLKFNMGVKVGDKDFELVSFDFSMGNLINLLITGGISGGKSVGAKCLIAQCVAKHFYIAFGDQKQGADFPFLLNYDRCILAQSLDEIRAMIYNVEREVKRRNTVMSSVGTANYVRYHAKTGKTLVPIIVFIEEYAQIRVKEGRDVDKMIDNLCALARSANVHFVIITQHASAKIIPTSFKNNLQNRIVYHMDTLEASGGALGTRSDRRALYLDIGRGLLKTKGFNWLEFQSFFAENEDYEEILAEYLGGECINLSTLGDIEMPEMVDIDEFQENRHVLKFETEPTKAPKSKQPTAQSDEEFLSKIPVEPIPDTLVVDKIDKEAIKKSKSNKKSAKKATKTSTTTVTSEEELQVAEAFVGEKALETLRKLEEKQKSVKKDSPIDTTASEVIDTFKVDNPECYKGFREIGTQDLLEAPQETQKEHPITEEDIEALINSLGGGVPTQSTKNKKE